MTETATARRAFRLTRAYSVVSLVGILSVALVMAFFYRAVAIDALMNVQDEANHDLTQTFARPIWFKYAEFVNNAGSLDADTLRNRPEVLAMREDVLSRMSGLRVVKVKVYDRSGLTVFSTEAEQIGQRKSNNPGIQGAMAGKVVSEIVFRDKFNAFDEVIENRDLLSSYIPLRLDENEEVVAVFELYSDITTLLGEVEKTEYSIMLLVAALMLALYLFLLIYVRRADGIILKLEEEERVMQQERIRYLAQHDQLTGLPNRILLIKLLNQAIQRVRHRTSSVAILFLDIDRFKLINDNLGIEAGNHVLLELIGRLELLSGEQTIIGRVGGDELVLVKSELTASGAEKLATQFISKLAEPMRVADSDVTVTVSIGITLFPEDNHDAEHLLQDAEAAMKRAKELGRNRFAFFTEELNKRAIERFELEHGLYKALANNEFEVYYQPRVDAKSRITTGAEALLRWRRGDGTIVSPALFIPSLEETGMIIQVGSWVLNKACQQCKAWHDAGHDNLHVSVNISAVQFEYGGLVNDVRTALLESGLPADALELELTESVLANGEEHTVRLLTELKSLGIRLSIDDFGTGYSSLSYLMHFPIDCLKIDQSFVRDAISNGDHANITRTIVAMAKSLRLHTVAEGVETEEHEQFLATLDCDELQGYLFSRPVPEHEFRAYLVK